MKALLFACCVVLFSAVLVNADLRPPVKPANQNAAQTAPEPKYILHTGLEITTDPKAYEARLQIPQSQLQNFRASLEGNPGITAVAGGIALSGPRTIIAGLLMFLAVSMAGVFLARSSSFGRTQKVLGAIVLVAVMLGAAAIITRGNAGPPGSYRWRNLPQALAKGEPTVGGVDVEVVPDDQLSGRMRLIIPLKKQNNPGDE
ncbi:MAG TPA: hypothetical protein VGD41_03980 [Pyrinomonadaceae bacterium]